MAFPAKKQSPSDFRASVTICSDFRAQEEPICHYFHLSPSICHEVMGLDAMVLVFLILSFKPALLLSSFTLLKRLFSSSSLSAIQFSPVHFSSSVVSDSLQPHELQHARPPCPSTNSQSSLRLISTKSVMPSSHLILCCPLLLLPLTPPSIRVFFDESTLSMRWPKYWSFSFSIIPSKEHPGLISFRMDWLDLQLQSKGPSRVFSNTTV